MMFSGWSRFNLVLFILILLVVVFSVLFLLLILSSTVFQIKGGGGCGDDLRYYVVEEVVDGDTIILEGGLRVRYLGLDAPEIHDRVSGVQCGAREATAENRRLVSGKRVRLVRDVSDRDRYGRLLRYVFTEDGVFVNYELVRGGYAQVLDVPPDSLFAYTFTEAQLDAKRGGWGLWSMCYNYTRGT